MRKEKGERSFSKSAGGEVPWVGWGVGSWKVGRWRFCVPHGQGRDKNMERKKTHDTQSKKNALKGTPLLGGVARVGNQAPEGRRKRPQPYSIKQSGLPRGNVEEEEKGTPKTSTPSE